MEQQEAAGGSRAFGEYLRKVRESRKLSLDAVEEMTCNYPGRVTKSHLSRIENGQAVPTFPRMFALSQAYGVPITSLAEKLDLDLKREQIPAGWSERSSDELAQDYDQKLKLGLYVDALLICDVLIEREPASSSQGTQARLNRVNCLVHLSRYSAAKEECETLLESKDLTPHYRVICFQLYAMCCYRLCRYTFALMAINRAEEELRAPGLPELLAAQLVTLKGNVLTVIGKHAEGISAYKEAIIRLDEMGQPFEACRARLNLSSALVDVDDHDAARKILDEVMAEAEAQSYDRFLAQALSNLGLISYKEQRFENAENCLLRSSALARPREYIAVVYRNCYYLWKIALARGDLPVAKTNERTLRAYLSRVEEYLPEAQDYRAHLASEVSGDVSGEVTGETQ